MFGQAGASEFQVHYPDSGVSVSPLIADGFGDRVHLVIERQQPRFDRTLSLKKSDMLKRAKPNRKKHTILADGGLVRLPFITTFVRITGITHDAPEAALDDFLVESTKGG